MGNMSSTDIIYKYCDGQMSARPGYYAGRGNNPSDLNSQLLEKVYTGVLTEHGKDAAQSFVRMVEVLEKNDDASATSFLTAFHRLAQNGWEFYDRAVPSNAQESNTEAVADAYKESPEAAYAVFLGALFGSTGYSGPARPITSAFLRKHAKETTGIARSDASRPSRYYGFNPDENSCR